MKAKLKRALLSTFPSCLSVATLPKNTREYFQRHELLKLYLCLLQRGILYTHSMLVKMIVSFQRMDYREVGRKKVNLLWQSHQSSADLSSDQ